MSPAFAAKQVDATCKIGGCSGTICQNANAEDFLTTCEWVPSYGCYQKFGICALENSKCSWQETPELKQCLSDPEMFGIQ
jgi:eight-cysteine-cluster-containing protein